MLRDLAPITIKNLRPRFSTGCLSKKWSCVPTDVIDIGHMSFYKSAHSLEPVAFNEDSGELRTIIIHDNQVDIRQHVSPKNKLLRVVRTKVGSLYHFMPSCLAKYTEAVA